MGEREKKFALILTHKTCNYDCPYCFESVEDKRLPMGTLATKAGAKKLATFLLGLDEEWLLSFSGGEPTLNPYFFQICKTVGQKHQLHIQTNLSGRWEEFTKALRPEGTILQCSLQPEGEKDIDQFMTKISKLVDHGYRITVTYVVTPERVDRIAKYAKRFHKLGVLFIVQGLVGNYQGKTYPQAYTDREYQIIKANATHYETILKLVFRQRTKPAGRFCSAGYSRMVIDGASGDIVPCNSWRIKLGNVYTGKLALRRRPVRCCLPVCDCGLFDEARKNIPIILGKYWHERTNISPRDWDAFSSILLPQPENIDYLTTEVKRRMLSIFSPAKRSIALYSAGSHTVKLLGLLKRMKLGNNIIAIFDKDERKWGGTIGSIRIYPPQAIETLKPDKIVISSRAYEDQIFKEVKVHGQMEIARIYKGNYLSALFAYLIINEMTIEDYFSASVRYECTACIPLSREQGPTALQTNL